MSTAETTPRPLVTAARVGAAVAVALFWLLLTAGRPWEVAPSEPLGNFYDAQAQALLHGHLDVDPAAVTFEGFRIGERTYMYQGPVPALMRMPVEAVTDHFHGRLTRVAMLAAYSLCMVFVVRLHRRIRELVRADAPAGRGEAFFTGVTTFGLGASSLWFLASKAWVYHEALLWGAAFSLAAFDHLIAHLAVPNATSRPYRHAVWASVFAGLAFLSRPSVGAGPIAALGLTVAVALVTAALSRRRLAGVGGLVVLAAGVLLPVAMYAGINQAKFGSLFSLPLDKQVLVEFDPARQESLAANGNSLFGVRYAPSVMLQTLRPDAFGFHRSFPFVGFASERPAVVGNVVFAERDWASSVPSSEPLLFVFAVVGLVSLVRPRRWGCTGAAPLRIPMLGAGVGGLAFCVLGYIANRYLSDLFPLLALAAITGAHVTFARVEHSNREWARPLLKVTIVVLAAWGAWMNSALALQYQREIAPGVTPGARAGWVELQARLGPGPAYERVRSGEPLPAETPLGALVVVGDCDALYRSNGAIWQPVESTPAAGGFDLTMTLEEPLAGPTPVIIAGSRSQTSTLLLESTDGGRVRLVISTTRGAKVTRTLPGAPFELAVDKPIRIDVMLDWRLGYAEVRHGDEMLLGVNGSFVAAVPEPSIDFPGELEAHSRPPTACRTLLG